jgi:hypothetical protein
MTAAPLVDLLCGNLGLDALPISLFYFVIKNRVPLWLDIESERLTATSPTVSAKTTSFKAQIPLFPSVSLDDAPGSVEVAVEGGIIFLVSACANSLYGWVDYDGPIWALVETRQFDEAHPHDTLIIVDDCESDRTCILPSARLEQVESRSRSRTPPPSRDFFSQPLRLIEVYDDEVGAGPQHETQQPGRENSRSRSPPLFRDMCRDMCPPPPSPEETFKQLNCVVCGSHAEVSFFPCSHVTCNSCAETSTLRCIRRAGRLMHGSTCPLETCGQSAYEITDLWLSLDS